MRKFDAERPPTLADWRPFGITALTALLNQLSEGFSIKQRSRRQGLAVGPQGF